MIWHKYEIHRTIPGFCVLKASPLSESRREVQHNVKIGMSHFCTVNYRTISSEVRRWQSSIWVQRGFLNERDNIIHRIISPAHLFKLHNFLTLVSLQTICCQFFSCMFLFAILRLTSTFNLTFPKLPKNPVLWYCYESLSFLKCSSGQY